MLQYQQFKLFCSVFNGLNNKVIFTFLKVCPKELGRA